MDRIPLFVRVPIPSSEPALRGRHSTSDYYGSVVSVRMTEASMDTIDEARSILGAQSRGMFIRQVAFQVARAIVQHYNAAIAEEKAKQNAGSTTSVRTPKRVRARRKSTSSD